MSKALEVPIELYPKLEKVLQNETLLAKRRDFLKKLILLNLDSMLEKLDEKKLLETDSFVHVVVGYTNNLYQGPLDQNFGTFQLKTGYLNFPL